MAVSWNTLLAACMVFPSVMFSQAVPDGQRLYQTRCAMCHELPLTAPFMNRHVLKAMAPESILNALDSGPMRSQGANLNQAERVAVAEFLTGKKVSQVSLESANPCANQTAKNLDGPRWNGWGVDLDN